MAEESLVTTLGFDAQQAIVTLQQLELGLRNYTVAMRKAASATRAYNKTAVGVEKNFKKQTAAATGYHQATNKVAEGNKIIDKTTKDAGKKLDELGKKTKATSGQMILSWQSVIRIFTIQVIHQLISKATQAMGDATRQAMDLEISLAEIQTIGGPLKQDFEGLADEVHNLSDAFGISADIVAEGIYQTLSNQVTSARKSFLFFAAAADFSIAAVTDADSAINLLSSTINAYGYNASQATLIGAKLFKTIELGRIRGEEFANTFGRVAVLASRLGVSLDEVLASIATLTISGLRYNEAFTLINNVMLKLIRPTDELKTAFRSLGIVTIEAGIQAYGFQGLLGKLADMTGGTATEMGKLFGRVRAVRGALGLTGAAAEKYAKNLEAIRAAGPETLFEARELIFKTNAKQVQMEIEELKNMIIFDFGRKSLATINKIIQAFGGLANIVTLLISTSGIGGLLKLFTELGETPIGESLIEFTTLMGKTTLIWQVFNKTVKDGIRERLDAEKKAIIEINAAEAKAAEARIQKLGSEFSAMQKYLVERLAAIDKIKQASLEAEALLTQNIHQQLSDRQSAFDTFVSTMIKGMERARDNINSIQSTIFSLQRELSREIFEGQTRSFDETRKVQINIRRGLELAQEAAREFRKGHEDRAKLLYAETRQLLGQAKTTAQSINNLTLERHARRTLTGIIEDQISLQKSYVRGEKTRLGALEQQIPIENARARRIAYLIEKIKKFALFTREGIISFGTEEEAIAAVSPLLFALQKEFDAVGSKINIFQRLEETGKKDLQNALLAALAPLEDIMTGKEISLQFAYRQRIHEVFRDIQDMADQIPIDIRMRFEELGFDVSTLKGIEDASKGLVEVFQSIEKSIRATSSLKGEQQLLKTELQGVDDLTKAINMNFDHQMGTGEKINIIWGNRAELMRRVLFLDADATKLAEQKNAILGKQDILFNQIEAAIIRARVSIEDTFNEENFVGAIRSLESVAALEETTGRIDVAKNIRLLIENLKEAAITAQGIQAITKGTEIQFGTEEINKIEEIFQRQKEIGQESVSIFQSMGTAAQVSATTGTSAFNTMVNDMSRVRSAANQTANAIAGIMSGVTTPGMARFGKMIYKQYGGHLSRGTDTIPTMLSAGEFVVNARSAKRFYSQLIAMNAGVQPNFRQLGGPVTNVGDVNITVQGESTPKQTAREMATALRREIRRKTSTLN